MHVRTIQCMSDRNNNSIQHIVENLHRHSNTNEFLLSINVSLWALQTHIEYHKEIIKRTANETF